MGRSFLAVVAALVVWTVVVTAGGLALGYGWPAYAAVEQAMAFDLSMKIARLSLSAVASVAAALTLWRIKPSLIAELLFGSIMLGAFIPVHMGLWPKFPIWYHLTFLSSLIILPPLFAMLVQPRSARVAGQGIR